VSHRHQLTVYDEISESGLPIHVTEFWASAKDLDPEGKCSPETLAELQSEYIANYMTCAFGHPAIEAFFFWGFMETAVKWREFSGHQVQPVFERVRKLINEEWMTRETLASDTEGVIRFRGFPGDYVLRGTRRTRAIPFRVDAPYGTESTLAVVTPPEF
jgi:hypothetical protein